MFETVDGFLIGGELFFVLLESGGQILADFIDSLEKTVVRGV